ncbi:hypothetical protein GCM10010411_67590 [Actinomadura fulvescens]|uniref:Integrase n=2 Tax=Actinomadura fulvescens TaxID=46160 RepID=A0ABP6CQN3_9ACTN
MVLVAIESGPLPPIRFHELRHGSATLSLLGKVDMKVISVTLGRVRSSFTAGTYTLVLPEVAKAAASVAGMCPPDAENAPAEVINFNESASTGGGSGI